MSTDTNGLFADILRVLLSAVFNLQEEEDEDEDAEDLTTGNLLISFKIHCTSSAYH